jgi:phosphoenolpyruvate synthase/pyruvate phosphate dikinase
MKYKRIWAREYGVQYSECAIRTLGPEVKDIMPVLMPDTLLYPEQGNEVFCINEEEFDVAVEKIRKMCNADDLKKLAGNFHKYGKRYVKFAKSIDVKKLEKMNNKELAEFYIEYCKIWDEYTAFLWIIFYLADFYAEKGQDILKNKGVEISAKESEALFSPIKRTGILELKDILMEYKKKKVEKLPEKELKKLVKNYAWISCLDYINKPWKEKDLEDFYEHLEVSNDGLDFEGVVRNIGLSKTDKDFFNQIREAAYLKDQRDVYRRLGIYYSFSLFDEIAKRLRIDRKESVYLTSYEILDALNGKLKVDLTEIKRRFNGFLIYRKDDRIVVNSDVKFIERFVRENVEGDEHKEIKGIVANKGHAKGIARIVLLVSDLKKVQKGDVLVSITTHPDFISAMQKASAFVTDEGGLMCHAAIVSREMKKPCIVGSKSATRLIKDGDLVEVDANKGIVKIVEKEK